MHKRTDRHGVWQCSFIKSKYLSVRNWTQSLLKVKTSCSITLLHLKRSWHLCNFHFLEVLFNLKSRLLNTCTLIIGFHLFTYYWYIFITKWTQSSISSWQSTQKCWTLLYFDLVENENEQKTFSWHPSLLNTRQFDEVYFLLHDFCQLLSGAKGVG